ncbi:sodium-dependent dicarboxylate transporter 2/3/5 [Altererythrobacter atlanticus]|uniref:Sodium-dependent dicarboxylate transporter SdcS n=1 Tax=Croceibacterium atlanticum TaxID=1267766 RepID=A0A0F7KXX6_9SPHN|nr:DASS family sodium-coupled anion symporter [Croceibacterium atlanticum]AKH44096.1 Sodium-dependent dicarboxylate transporter SdcS [Croceibacterium atlanticum]MBB5732406.1 sodium-dependent dicarboxylate transporter 2/3/5 [Croceibacterium atlanticum]
MNAQRIGFWLGLAAFSATIILPAPAGMSAQAWSVAGLVMWMAAWWMTEAIPLTATALLPFAILPFAGVGSPNEVASDYYSPILFLILGGAFLALAIERTGLHKRLAVFVLDAVGTGGPMRVMLAFMVSAAILSNIISNTSTSLIMMPMALAVLAGGGANKDQRMGLSGALPMAIAFAASIGGLGTIIGSPTNAIAVALLRETIGLEISFALWMVFGVPIVILGIPLAAFLIARVQRIADHPFDAVAAREAIKPEGPWTGPEKRLVPVILLAFLLWMTRPLTGPYLPPGSLTDGTIAVVAGLALFILPDGTGRRLLNWTEANRAPWDVIMMFGGGLALAGAMTRSGLADWLGQALLPLASVPLPIVALAVVGMVVLITEFASNVATASGIIPVVASLAVALGVDPILLAMPAAMAASWGFMLPAGTGPNAIAWATGRIELPRMVSAGLLLDICGIFLIVGTVWAIKAFI